MIKKIRNAGYLQPLYTPCFLIIIAFLLIIRISSVNTIIPCLVFFLFSEIGYSTLKIR